MNFTKKFKKISKSKTKIAGGKGSSLGEMMRAGISVPRGFVILSNAFDKFMKETNLDEELNDILEKTDIKKVHAVEKASKKIKARILSSDIPNDIRMEILKNYKKFDFDFVAVRSSATAEDSESSAWAGQLDSFLNITEENLLESVKKCWASLFNSRAIFYRSINKLNKNKISVAVVVQKMVQAQKAGIAFSVHPVKHDINQIIIEAGFGLGEAIVSGSIIPDNYSVNKQPLKIADIKINKQSKALFKKNNGGNEWKKLGERGSSQVLSKKEIMNLSKTVVKIEKHFGFPVDIEWAIENNNIFILQSRPITIIVQNTQKNMVNPEDYKILFRLKDKSNFLINSFLLEGSLKFGDPLIINRDGYWTFYLNKNGIKKIEKRGFDLFKNDSLFKKYSKSFNSYIQSANKQIIPKYQKTRTIGEKKLKVIINELSRLWYFYGFTEAVYHDFTYEKMTLTTNEKLKKKLSDNLHALINLKERGRKIFNAYVMKDGIINKILSQIESQKSLETRDASHLTIKELESLLRNGTINKKIIRERKIAYTLGLFNGKLIKFNSEESTELAEKFYNFEELQYKKAEKEIAGVAVSGGIVRGKVIIAPMLDKNEAEKIAKKMKKGDVLVAQSTNPDLIILCEKASAIVTDQGGLLSHAAIISREMGKPCIVGTIFATKILRDGDLVEVDADNGIIRIFKKTKTKKI